MKSRFFSLLLALCLLSTLMIPAFAEDAMLSSDEQPTMEEFTVDAFEAALAASYAAVNEANAANAAALDVDLASNGLTLSATAYQTDGCTINASLLSDGKYWLFMPAGSDPKELALSLTYNSIPVDFTVSGLKGSAIVRDGSTIDLEALCGTPSLVGYYTVTVNVNSTRITLCIRFSENVSAMYLTSDDPIHKGRTWVEASEDKSNKATGSMVLQNPDGTVVYSGGLTQIKGRGNSTWGMDKKPYQIKTSSKIDLLETGNKKNANKTWVLLANAYDSTLLHNAVTFDIARSLGMEVGIEYRFVDLYYDGEYRGSYLLCEKVSIDPGRVDVNKLENDNEDANPDVDLGSLASGTGTTENGATYVYTQDMNSPENISGGYLLEMDFEERAKEEACYFCTAKGNYVVVKSPEYCSEAEISYIASLYQDFETAVYQGGTNKATGKKTSDYMDMDSIVQTYWVNEFSKNVDSYRSSAYIYKDADCDTMYMGPVWDYDICYGLANATLYPELAISSTGWWATSTPFSAHLYQDSEFRIAAYRLYRDTLSPLLNEVLLGDEDACSETEYSTLHSLKWYEAQTAASAACNYSIWTPVGYNRTGYTYESNLRFMENWITERSEWLDTNYPGRVFEDVAANQWYATRVDDAAALGLMNGVGNNNFAPSAYLTRAEMTQVLYNHADRPETEDTLTFTDIDHSAWYIDALSWAVENHVVYGNPDNTFHPFYRISRQDVVVLLYRNAGEPEVTDDLLSQFSDCDQISDYAKQAMEWALENDILHGYQDSTVRPLNPITRAECATLLVNAFS